MGFKVIYMRCAGRWWGRSRTMALAGGVATLLAGCASLPSSGPTADQIVHAGEGRNRFPFQVIDIDADRSSGEAKTSAPAGASLASLDRAGAVDRIGPGDVLQISIFEVGAAIFAPTSGASVSASGKGGFDGPTSATGANLQPVTVESDGTITLPYIGRLDVAGKTSSQAQQMIADGLKGKSQAAQAMVSVRDNVSATVVVMGEVKKPGRVPLTSHQDRVLDAVAFSGGFNYPQQDMVVRVTRGDRSASARLTDLAAGSANNILLLPQDRIELLYIPQTFSVFGAAAKVQEVPFPSPRVDLAEAIAQAGGPLDQQADPSAIFVFRYSAVDMDGFPLPGATPIVYRLDMLRPESYFLAQGFAMRSHDLIYVSNARSNQPAKLLQILNLFFSPVYTAKVVSQ